MKSMFMSINCVNIACWVQEPAMSVTVEEMPGIIDSLPDEIVAVDPVVTNMVVN